MHGITHKKIGGHLLYKNFIRRNIGYSSRLKLISFVKFIKFIKLMCEFL